MFKTSALVRWTRPTDLKLSGDNGLKGQPKNQTTVALTTNARGASMMGGTMDSKYQPKDPTTAKRTTDFMTSALVRWTRPTDQKPTGDIGLNGSAKESTTVARPTNER